MSEWVVGDDPIRDGAVADGAMSTEQIKALLTMHQRTEGRRICDCGWVAPTKGIPLADEHRAHVAEVIAREAGESQARLRDAEARLEELRDLFGEPKWLDMSMWHLYQIRDKVLSIVNDPR